MEVSWDAVTLSTSYISSWPTSLPTSDRTDLPADSWRQRQHASPSPNNGGLSSTGKGILIGMLSAFGSAALVALIVAVVYFFRHTQSGRIFLDRIGRPGEFDDEQQFLREEEEALAEMDDLQRAEYHRAKGASYHCKAGYTED